MRLMITAAVAALALVFAGTAADAKAKKAKTKTYSFEVMCPAIAPKPVHMGNCAAAGKSKEAARAICQGKHYMCGMKSGKKAKHARKHKKHAKKKS